MSSLSRQKALAQRAFCNRIDSFFVPSWKRAIFLQLLGSGYVLLDKSCGSQGLKIPLGSKHKQESR
jgi:hypothetical protein